MMPKTKAQAEVKTVDEVGRVALGKGFAGKLVTVREVDDTEVVVTVVRIVPERDVVAPKEGARGSAPKGRARTESKGMWAESRGPSRRIMRRTDRLANAVTTVLTSEGRPMTTSAIAKAMLARGLWGDEGDGGAKLGRAVWHVVGGRSTGAAKGRFVKTPTGYALAAGREGA